MRSRRNLTQGDLLRVLEGTERIQRFSDRAVEVSRGHSRCGNEPGNGENR